MIISGSVGKKTHTCSFKVTGFSGKFNSLVTIKTHPGSFFHDRKKLSRKVELHFCEKQTLPGHHFFPIFGKILQIRKKA